MTDKREINPNALYSISDLEKLFGCQWETIAENLKLNKRVFKNCITGFEVLTAIQTEANARFNEPAPVRIKIKPVKQNDKPNRGSGATLSGGLQLLQLTPSDK